MSATESAVTAGDLRPIDLFADLSDAELAEWAHVSRWRIAAPGEVVVEAGTEPDGVVCLTEGTLQTLSRHDGHYEPAGHQYAPTWIGAIATLSESSLGVRMVALTPARAAIIPAEDFRRLALANPSVHRRIMRQVGPVMSRITAVEQNRERLAALGTMAAGLAHELNNPASAARRSAAQLGEALDAIAATVREMVQAGIEREDAGRIVVLQEQAVQSAAGATALGALDASDAEEAMVERLEALGVPDAWRLAESLALAQVDDDWLNEIHDLAGRATAAVLQSVAATISAGSLVRELRDSTERMSGLVGAVKAYAYMDRGGVVEVDVHEGLETTLAVLAHKLKHTHIEIVRDYDRTLPHVTVYGSALNQVWTNLLDNAIDALGTSGTITLRTRRDGECVLVEVSDTGPGIPDADRSRVFEPFFTTKEVGLGSGLGLDTARRIVREQHGGTITFDTGGSGTTFHVWLPLDSVPTETEATA